MFTLAPAMNFVLESVVVVVLPAGDRTYRAKGVREGHVRASMKNGTCGAKARSDGHLSNNALR